MSFFLRIWVSEGFVGRRAERVQQNLALDGMVTWVLLSKSKPGISSPQWVINLPANA